MSHAEQSNEDIQREAERLQGRSTSRRNKQKKDKAYKKASRGVLAGAAIAATIAGGSYLANKGESSPAQGEPGKEKQADNPSLGSAEAPSAEAVDIPVTSVEGAESQPIAVNEVVEFDAEGQPIPQAAEPTGGVEPTERASGSVSPEGGVVPPN